MRKIRLTPKPRIRLTIKLPVDPRHGCSEGAEFTVQRFETDKYGRIKAIILSKDDRQEVVAFWHEIELISSNEALIEYFDQLRREREQSRGNKGDNGAEVHTESA